MQIIGITGAIGHGKTSLAEAFLSVEPKSLHLESFYVVAEVADALHEKLSDVPDATDLAAINDWLAHLPDILQKALHLHAKPLPIVLDSQTIQTAPADYDKLFAHIRNLAANPDLARQKITAANKQAYRPILQWLGGYVTTHIDARAWYQELIRRAQAAAEDGVELVVIGGVRFPNDASVLHEAGGKVIEIVRPGATQPDMSDPTERERELIKADCMVVNNGSLEDLRAIALKVLEDLRDNKLAAEYRAAA